MAQTQPPDIELNITPHPARPGWRTVRIVYAVVPPLEGRITAALDALFGPVREPFEPREGAE